MKRSILAIILCFFLVSSTGCNIKDIYSAKEGKRSYISLSYLDINKKYNSTDKAKKFLAKHKNQCVEWTIPVKSILNSKYLILQAKSLCEVYAQFNYNFSKSGKFAKGKYITISGYLDSYCRSFLGESPYWTLKNCRIEKVSGEAESKLKNYLETASDSSGSGTISGQTTADDSDESSMDDSESSQAAAFSLKVPDFKTELLAKDKKFEELPSFKDGGNVTLGDYYYAYQTNDINAKYEIFLNAEDDTIYSIEFVQNAVPSDIEKTRAQNIYKSLLYVVYGNKDNTDYESAISFVKDFITRNTRYNDFHVASSTIGSYKITLEMRSKTQEFRMIILPEQ